MPAPRSPICRPPSWPAMSCAWTATARRGAISCHPAQVAKGDRPIWRPRAAASPLVQRPLPAGHAAGCDDTVCACRSHDSRPAHGWRDVVRSNQKVASDQATFTIWVYQDPLYQEPLVLGTNLAAQPTTIFHLYLDRWPVEEVPLVSKQLLGLHRQFVFAAAAADRPAGISAAGGQHPDTSGGQPAGLADRLLGSPAPAHTWSPAPRAESGRFSQRVPLGRASSGKTLGVRPIYQRG